MSIETFLTLCFKSYFVFQRMKVRQAGLKHENVVNEDRILHFWNLAPR